MKKGWRAPVFSGRLNRGHRRFFGTHRIGFFHSTKDGGPVLIGEASILTISGVYVNHPWGWFGVQFRRRGKKYAK